MDDELAPAVAADARAAAVLARRDPGEHDAAAPGVVEAHGDGRADLHGVRRARRGARGRRRRVRRVAGVEGRVDVLAMERARVEHAEEGLRRAEPEPEAAADGRAPILGARAVGEAPGDEVLARERRAARRVGPRAAERVGDDVARRVFEPDVAGALVRPRALGPERRGLLGHEGVEPPGPEGVAEDSVDGRAELQAREIGVQQHDDAAPAGRGPRRDDGRLAGAEGAPVERERRRARHRSHHGRGVVRALDDDEIARPPVRVDGGERALEVRVAGAARRRRSFGFVVDLVEHVAPARRRLSQPRPAGFYPSGEPRDGVAGVGRRSAERVEERARLALPRPRRLALSRRPPLAPGLRARGGLERPAKVLRPQRRDVAPRAAPRDQIGVGGDQQAGAIQIGERLRERVVRERVPPREDRGAAGRRGRGERVAVVPARHAAPRRRDGPVVDEGLHLRGRARPAERRADVVAVDEERSCGFAELRLDLGEPLLLLRCEVRWCER